VGEDGRRVKIDFVAVKSRLQAKPRRALWKGCDLGRMSIARARGT
jgi:hypothetical protein